MSIRHGKGLINGTVTADKLAGTVAAAILDNFTLGSFRKASNLSVGAVDSIQVTAAIVAGAVGGDVRTSVSDGSEVGVYVGAVANGGDEKKVKIMLAGSDNGVDDGAGDDVYGKITHDGTDYTLSFFKGSDNTAYTFPTGPTLIDYCFVEYVPGSQLPANLILLAGNSGLIDTNIAQDLAGHLTDSEGAHDSSAISYDGTGRAYTVSSTNAKAAIDALDVRASAAASEIAANTAAITSNDADIAQNASDIAALQGAASSFQRQRIALLPADVTNRYVDLSGIPETAENVRLVVKSLGAVLYGDHFAIISDGADDKRLTWDSADAGVTDGLESLLDATDVLDVYYEV